MIAEDANKIERQIAYLSFEVAIGWDSTNKQVLRIDGDRNKFTLTNKQGMQIFNGFLTHNHPYPHFVSPSFADLMIMKNYHLKEVRSCAPNGDNWRKVEHRIARRNSRTTPHYDEHEYLSVLYETFVEHKISYKPDPKVYFIVSELPRSPKIVAALDEALNKLSHKWDFTYIKWCD